MSSASISPSPTFTQAVKIKEHERQEMARTNLNPSAQLHRKEENITTRVTCPLVKYDTLHNLHSQGWVYEEISRNRTFPVQGIEVPTPKYMERVFSFFKKDFLSIFPCILITVV